MLCFARVALAGASIDKVWSAYTTHQLGYTLPQILLHLVALTVAQDTVSKYSTLGSLGVSIALFLGLAVSCSRSGRLKFWL